MKKVALMIIILLLVSFVPLNFAFSAGERTAKGRVEVGGDISFIHNSYDGGSITQMSIMPRIGYFVIPKLAVEPKLLVSHFSVNPEYGDDYSTTDFGAIFSAAYHFEGASENQYVPFIFGGLGFISHSGDVGDADEMTMIMPDIGGGIKVFFTDDALLRAELFYQHVSNANGVKDADADDFGLRAGVSIFVK